MKLEYTLGQSHLGPILAAFSQKGLCALLLGQNIPLLITELGQRFPQKTLVLVKGKKQFDDVLKLINNPRSKVVIPLDEHGTEFQLKVWKTLREIPVGSIASYSEIAKKMNHPKAARAVAKACATNNIAVITPCHRVIRSDGHLSGYYWGIEYKQKLLDLEKSLFTN